MLRVVLPVPDRSWLRAEDSEALDTVAACGEAIKRALHVMRTPVCVYVVLEMRSGARGERRGVTPDEGVRDARGGDTGGVCDVKRP
jgi:hypothetical protein